MPVVSATRTCRASEAAGIRGRIRPTPPWRNPSFRGYADHMQTPEFGKLLAGYNLKVRKIAADFPSSRGDPQSSATENPIPKDDPSQIY